MLKKRGFTLIELMVVILIVSILAAVAVPIMRGRIDAAKWSEGKAMAGTLSTSLRAYAAEKGANGVYGDQSVLTLGTLGFANSDFTGTYFVVGNYSWISAYNAAVDPALTFTISVVAPAGITTPGTVTLNQAGVWTP
jgi:type IV pilus assembly protein PilA